jgi:hypothetical protein
MALIDVIPGTPDFALTDVVDPTTGENNVIEPTNDYKQYGWYPAGMKPKRGFMNWIHRKTAEYLQFITDEVVPGLNSSYDRAVPTDEDILDFGLRGFESPVTFKVHCKKYSDGRVVIDVDGVFGVSSDTNMDSFTTAIPSKYLSNVILQACIPVALLNGATTPYLPNAIGVCQILTSGMLQFKTFDGSVFNDNGFINEHVKGFAPFSFSYVRFQS